MTDLAGKAALVTGGSRGIGAAISRHLAHHGADVALTYKTAADRAANVVSNVKESGRRGLAIAADVAQVGAVVDAVERATAELGRLDVLVNSAGIFSYGPVDDVTLEEYENTMAIHVRAVFFATQAAVRHMEQGGRVINIGSSIAVKVPSPGVALYAMSKQALVGLTKGLAHDLGPRGITVNLVHPGPTDTEMNPAAGPRAEDQRALTVLGRYGTADDIAATVVHLAGESGRFITGTTIAVDGGWSA
jgi:NAD(P)-dependent dehydrogenase (short-subunit alcohol dehydrogenase family)